MNPNYYAIIPANVRYDKSLTPNAKLLYGELTALSNQEGYCWASNSYFAELYSVSNTSISKWISNLEDKGYIRTELRYKEGTKQISERRIYIIDNITSNDTPIEEKLNTPLRKVKGGIEEKLNTPIEEKLKDNNTVYNNTINNTDNKSSPSSKKESKQTIPKEELGLVIDKWNNIAENTKITKVRAINPRTKRYKMLNARIKEYGLEEVLATISEISRSSFLQGENARGWSISFDWFIAPNNFLKVLEGTYRDKQPTNTGNKLLNSDYRVSTEEDLARDEDGNLISF